MKTQDRNPQGSSDRIEKSSVTNRPYELTDLPFVSVSGGMIDYWTVTRTGDAVLDRATGFENARQLAAFMDQREDHPRLLNCVIQAIVTAGKFGPLEEGFFEAIGIATLGLHNALRLGLVRPGLFGKPIVYLGYVAPKHGHYDRPPGRIHAQDSGEND